MKKARHALRDFWFALPVGMRPVIALKALIAMLILFAILFL